MANPLQVIFECSSLPLTGIAQPNCRRLGIQEAKTVTQDVPFEGQELIRFSFPLLVDMGSSQPVFKGKFVQGPRSDPFIYLSWGDREGEAWVQVGRAKILLGTIPPGQLERALRESGALMARIQMVDIHGKPAMGTLKPRQVAWIE